MSAYDSDITDLHPGSGTRPLCDVGHECVTHTGVGGEHDSTVRTLGDLAETVRSRAEPPVDEADQLQRWLSFLEPRFACGERHSSTHASWVFRGLERESNTAVAVKLLKDSRPELRNAFSVEALLLSQLEHPGIVRYMAHGELAEGGAYIVTEWLEGEELGTRLGRGPLSVGEALTLITRAGNVLAAAHARGVVHLDLKPSNLFLEGGDLANIRLLDFGIARLTRSVISDPEDDLVAGTPGYMAPEQVLGEALSPATDVFALGCLLYRCIVGHRIFEGSPIDVMTRTVEEPVRLDALLPVIHPALAQLLAWLLDPEPAKRPADAARVLAAIAELPSELLDDLAPSARALLSPSGLTVAERVPSTVVLVRHAADDREAIARNADGRKRYSSYFETLADGRWIALPRGNATPLDQALHAARLSLDVHAHWPRAAIAVIAGRTVDGASTQLHELLAEAEASVASARAGQILLDETSAQLVSGKFLIADGEGPSAQLLGERSPAVEEERRAGSSLCLGRETELASLLELAKEAFRGSRARVALLTGLAGVGKSALLSELLAGLSSSKELFERPTIWSVYGDPMSAGSALHFVSALVEAEPGLASSALLGLLNPEDVDSTQAGEVRIAGSVDAVHRAFADHVEAQLARGPLLLCLEDIHWADLGSLRAIDFLLSALSERPLLIIATGRPEVHELYPDLWQRRSVRELRLGELCEADAERVVSLRLGQELAPAVRARIVQRARGNAFLLHELIRAEVEGRGDEVSETVQDVVQSRLRALAPDARRVLRAASILGDPFSPRGVTFLLGEGSDESDVERWLNLLVSREVLRRRDDAQPSKGVLVFAHAVMRDAAYDLLTESDRALGHRLAARWFEAAERCNPTVTALHYARAGDRAGAGRWYFRATMDAFKIGDFSATAGSAEQALCYELGQHERGHVQAVAAHAYRLLGNVEKSTRLSAEALRALPPNSPLWREAARTAMMAGASTGRHRDG